MALLAATLLASCSHPIDGRPVLGSKNADPGFFFAGDVPVYGQQVGRDDVGYLAYLRALRRVDVCGMLTGDALAKVGQIVSVGTLFAFDECDAEVKISGVSERRFVSVELELSATEPSGCEALARLPLGGLPGAPIPPEPAQPSVRVEMIAAQDCELTKRIAGALQERLATRPLPTRDAAAAYPARLAERDPCEVLSEPTDVVAWDVRGSRPYLCSFTVRGVAMQVRLEPQVIDAGPTACSAVSLVGAPMQRKVIGVGYVDPADVVIRPAVVVQGNCEGDEPRARTAERLVADVAVKAAKLYG